MKLKGCINKSTRGEYTVTFKVDGVSVFKQKEIAHLEDARDIYWREKRNITEAIPYMRSFPELEGKIVNWRNGALRCKGKIVACDYHIGLTIVEADKPTHYLSCLRGPSSVWATKEQKMGFFHHYNDYPFTFVVAIKALLRGEYDIRANYRLITGQGYKVYHGNAPNRSNCAFSV